MVAILLVWALEAMRRTYFCVSQSGQWSEQARYFSVI
jgi:hypothetical protein